MVRQQTDELAKGGHPTLQALIMPRADIPVSRPRDYVAAATPDLMTEPAARFFVDNFRVSTFFADVTDAREFDMPGFRKQLGEIQSGTLPPETETALRWAVGRMDHAQKIYEGEQSYLILQMILCRTVDNFLTYVSDLMTLIFRERPEVMRSNDKVSFNDVLQFSSMPELIAHLADRRVHELSYRGLSDLAKYFEEQMGIALAADPDALRYLAVSVEIRNLISHNRGRVNQMFLDRLKRLGEATNLRVGDEFTWAGNKVLDVMMNIDNAVNRLDERAVAHFKLPRTKTRLDVLPQEARMVVALA
jgi:hypothetical protein